ncbi:MAG: sigma-70 family RNA polymerase sigma factor [Kangiellaceae bacterium]|nr:sigma-70 family RNA polymerase sigma factor [Kangiellaceae bacterium]
MSSERTDNELIASVVSSQDKQAFAVLMNRYQSAIRQFARRLTGGDYHLADDIAQETFWLAYQKIAAFKALGSFNSWLHTIAYRQFLLYINKVKIDAQVEFHEDSVQLTSEPQSAMEADMIAEKLMQKLSLPERVTITLSYSAGMSHSEICDITELPLGTVKSHIQRGKQKLSQMLGVDEQVA